MSLWWRAIALVVGAVAAFLAALVCALISYFFPKPPSASALRRCCVCQQAAPDILLLDCRHLATCRNCMGPLDRWCPLCRHSPLPPVQEEYVRMPPVIVQSHFINNIKSRQIKWQMLNVQVRVTCYRHLA